jgi:hypothetical protein
MNIVYYKSEKMVAKPIVFPELFFVVMIHAILFVFDHLF